jgi:hypothetical protein
MWGIRQGMQLADAKISGAQEPTEPVKDFPAVAIFHRLGDEIADAIGIERMAPLMKENSPIVGAPRGPTNSEPHRRHDQGIHLENLGSGSRSWGESRALRSCGLTRRACHVERRIGA